MKRCLLPALLIMALAGSLIAGFSSIAIAQEPGGTGNVCYVDANKNGTFDQGTDVKYGSVQAAINETGAGETESNPTVIRLCADDAENVTIPEGRFITLDLDGYVLKASGLDADNNTVITNNGRLTIKDSNTNNQTHNFKVGADYLWTLTDENATKTFETLDAIPAAGDVIEVNGGCITGGTGTINPEKGIRAGGILNNNNLYLEGGSIVGNWAEFGAGIQNGTRDLEIEEIDKVVFTIAEGNVIGNRSISNETDDGHGGGIDNYGTLNIKGGRVMANHSGGDGGAGIMNFGILSISGGAIAFNTSNGPGGGLTHEGYKFVMTDGLIYGNVATSGGGISQITSYSGILNGGTITGNKATKIGCGVAILFGNITVGGTVKIYGNGEEGLGTNLEVADMDSMTPVAFNIGDGTQETLAPTGDMKVGVTILSINKVSYAYESTDGPFTTNGKESDRQYFFSDDPKYGVIFNTDHLELGEATIQIDPGIVHGNVVVSDPCATSGDVEIVALPEDGYELDKIIVKDDDGTDITDEVLDGTTLSVPEDLPVIVSAIFVEIPSPVPDDPADDPADNPADDPADGPMPKTGDSLPLYMMGLVVLGVMAMAGVFAASRARKDN